MDGFAPQKDPRAFRTALGRFTTGVTVILAEGDKGPVGMTVNSFASLSLDPALILWSPAKASARHDTFLAAKAFNIHVLADDQQAVCDAFVRPTTSLDQFEMTRGQNGLPVISGCLALFECRQYAVHDGGDHTLIIGEVTYASERPGAPLIFQDGAFGTMQR